MKNSEELLKDFNQKAQAYTSYLEDVLKEGDLETKVSTLKGIFQCIDELTSLNLQIERLLRQS